MENDERGRDETAKVKCTAKLKQTKKTGWSAKHFIDKTWCDYNVKQAGKWRQGNKNQCLSSPSEEIYANTGLTERLKSRLF